MLLSECKKNSTGEFNFFSFFLENEHPSSFFRYSSTGHWKLTMTAPKKDGFSLAASGSPVTHPKASKAASVGFNILNTVLVGISTAVIKKCKLGGNTATLGTGIIGVLIGLSSYLLSNANLIRDGCELYIRTVMIYNGSLHVKIQKTIHDDIF